MSNHHEGREASPGPAVALAAVSSVVFAALFWFWERDLIWMLAVVLPPIWSPVLYRRFADGGTGDSKRLALGVVLVGLVLVLAVGVLAYVAS